MELVGNKFGLLTILASKYCDDRASTYVYCQCECGNEVNILRSSLLSGLTRSCGCLQREKCSTNDLDIVGKKFNKLTVISFAFTQNHRKFYNCLCDCGNTTTARPYDLRSGHKKTCGRCGKNETNTLRV